MGRVSRPHLPTPFPSILALSHSVVVPRPIRRTCARACVYGDVRATHVPGARANERVMANCLSPAMTHPTLAPQHFAICVCVVFQAVSAFVRATFTHPCTRTRTHVRTSSHMVCVCVCVCVYFPISIIRFLSILSDALRWCTLVG